MLKYLYTCCFNLGENTMSLVNALTNEANLTTGENGDVAYKSTLNANLDFFGISGNIGMIESTLKYKFDLALIENTDLALRNLLHMRDIRGGKGVRKNARVLLNHLIFETKVKAADIDAMLLLAKFVGVGRWDDLLSVFGKDDRIDNCIIAFFMMALNSDNPSLAAKWTPLNQKDNTSKIFMSRLRKQMGLSPKDMRKLIVSKRNIVETKMCENLWSDINYSQVPSQAMRIYKRAFGRNDEVRFEEFNDKALNGEVKINAITLYPHEVLGNSRSTPDKTAEAQWKALPNYIKDGVSILPLVDVSGSMDCKAYSNYSCMDISIALGMYLADKNTTHFKDCFITFEAKPSFVKFNGNECLANRKIKTRSASWGGSTNLDAAMRLILDSVIKHNLTQVDLPDYLVVLSDMQFNGVWDSNVDVSTRTKGAFQELGLKCPKLIWWNLSQSSTNSPVKFDDSGNAFISGFSPSIMTAVLSDDLEQYTPENVMLKTLLQDKYSV